MRQTLLNAAFILLSLTTSTGGVRDTKDIEQAFSEQMREETFEAFKGIIEQAVAAGKLSLGAHGQEGMQIFKELFDIDEIAQAAHAANLKEELVKLSQSKEGDSSAAIEALMQKPEMKKIDDLMVKHLEQTPGKLQKLSSSFEEALSGESKGSAGSAEAAGGSQKAHSITVEGFQDITKKDGGKITRTVFNGVYTQDLKGCHGGHPTYTNQGKNKPVIYFCKKNSTMSGEANTWYITSSKDFQENIKQGVCMGYAWFEQGNILETSGGKGLRMKTILGENVECEDKDAPSCKGGMEPKKHRTENTPWVANVGVSTVTPISGSPKDCSNDPIGK